MPWLTPDDDPTMTSWVVFVPDGAGWKAALLGALLELAQEKNWEKYGAQEPEDVAQRWAEAMRQTEIENAD